MQSIILHQALHGYTDGHRALGCTIELGPKDTKTLLILSDISGPGARLETSGYLTGYPLPDSGLYALARTWPAPEMPRPGCVWTHTLLIDFADLATITDPSQLLQLFQRPENAATSTSMETVTFNEQHIHRPYVNDKLISISKPLIYALYEHPTKSIVSLQDEPGYSEEAVLALWAQQWPRLRRSFRFCTSSLSDRSTKEVSFDLQFIPRATPDARSRFANSIEARTIEYEADWVQIAIDDLILSQAVGLRRFMYQAGSDLVNGRSKFADLCRIYSMLKVTENKKNEMDILLELIPEPSNTNIARALKGIVVRSLLSQRSPLSRSVLSFIVDHLSFLDTQSIPEDANVFGYSLLMSHPKLFLKMAQVSDIGLKIFQSTLAMVPTNEILQATKQVTELLPLALQTRVELLEDPVTWSLIRDIDADTLDHLIQKHNSPAMLTAIISSERVDIADALLKRVNRIDLVSAVHQAYFIDKVEINALIQWMRTISTPKVISELFLSIKEIDRRFILVVSELYSPDEIPSNSDIDPWLHALSISKNELFENEELSLRTYILTRSFGDDICNSAELAKFGFEATDQALAKNTIPYSSWSRLDKILPQSIFWLQWDKCHRLRRGLIDRCISKRWSSDIFINLTLDDELFIILASIADSSNRGHSYLKTVKRDLQGSTDHYRKKRFEIIRYILKGRW